MMDAVRKFRIDADEMRQAAMPSRPNSEPIECVRIPNDGNWEPACGGNELPFVTRTRRRLLYCWNPVSGEHRYLDCDRDMILTDEEARLAIAVD